MAIAVNVDGAALVKVGTGSASALETLGYSVNGITIIENVFMADVPGDQNGGEEGPPIDIQYFGRVDRIRMELSKYDTAVADKIRTALNDLGVTGPGAAPSQTAGSLVFGDSFGYRLLIQPTSRPRNYLLAIPRFPTEENKGTKYSRLVLEWEAHAVSGVLYNTTTS